MAHMTVVILSTALVVSTTTNVPIAETVNHNIALSVSNIIWAFVNVIIFFAIIFGNALTIIAVRNSRHLKSMISNLFILSLAISDLIVGMTLPYHLAFYLGSDLGKSRELCLMRFFLIIFACCVSSLTLIAIAVDRYIAIVYALHYRRFMTRRVAIFIIALNWLLGATIAVIPMFWNHWKTAFQCEFNEVLPAWYMAGMITPGFTLIWVIMSLLYWRIMREASKHAKQLRGTSNNGQHSNIHSDWKSVQVVFIIMGCFSICWCPYFIVACMEIFDVFRIASIVYKGAFSLAMANSGLNPIIYSWKNSNFRKAFALVLRCKSANTGPHNVEGSHFSVPSHYVPRQQSTNSMNVVALTPFVTLESHRQQIIEDARAENNITEDILYTTIAGIPVSAVPKAGN